MDAQLLIQQLAFLEPEKRLAAARIIGLTDEVDAYPALYRAVKTEADPAVRKAMAWAGKRLQAAQAAEYTTIDAIWEYFHIDRDVYPPEDDRDEPFLGLDAHQVEMVTAQVQYESALRKAHARQRRLAFSSVYPILGALPGMLVENATVAIAASNSAQILDASIGVSGNSRRRAMPTEPTTTDIRHYVKRLLSEPDAEKRRKAALSLRDLNNPAALDPLARAFMRDPEPQVAQTAHLAGKLIYWNAVYWKLEKDGWIAEEIAHRIRLAEEAEKPKRKIRRLSQVAPAHAEAQAHTESPTQLAVPAEPSRPAIRRLPKPAAVAPSEASSLTEAPTQHARPIAPKTKPKRSESVIPQMPTQSAEKEAIERLLQKGMAKRRRPY